MIYYQYLIRPRDVTAEYFVSVANEVIRHLGLGLYYAGDGEEIQRMALTEVTKLLAEYPGYCGNLAEIILTEGEFDHE